jgi:hypothetical protein
VRNLEQLVHLFAHRETRSMQPDPDSSRLKVEDLRNLFGRQFLHVAKYKDNAQLHGNTQDCLM